MDWNLEILRPREYLSSIYEIDFDNLRAMGFKAVIMDIDDTIIPRKKIEITPRLYSLIESIKEKGFKICLLSNNFYPEKVEHVSRILKVPSVSVALKPLPFAFEKALKILGSSKSETLVIGDQIFMDILGGNLAGIYSILVKPISKETFWLRRWMREAEKFALRRLNLEP